MLWREAYTGEGAANTQCKREKKGLLVGIAGSATTGLNTWCSYNKSMKFCAVLGAQGIRAMGFKRAQGNVHFSKFESDTNRITFETTAISTVYIRYPGPTTIRAIKIPP